MALQINKVLVAKDGGLIDTGSFVKIDTSFPMEGLTYYNTMKIWRSEDAYNVNLAPIKPVEIPNLNFSTELTPQEYSGVTPTDVLNNAKVYLENYLGEGTVEIIMDFS